MFSSISFSKLSRTFLSRNNIINTIKRSCHTQVCCSHPNEYYRVRHNDTTLSDDDYDFLKKTGIYTIIGCLFMYYCYECDEKIKKSLAEETLKNSNSGNNSTEELTSKQVNITIKNRDNDSLNELKKTISSLKSQNDVLNNKLLSISNKLAKENKSTSGGLTSNKQVNIVINNDKSLNEIKKSIDSLKSSNDVINKKLISISNKLAENNKAASRGLNNNKQVTIDIKNNKGSLDEINKSIEALKTQNKIFNDKLDSISNKIVNENNYGLSKYWTYK